MLMTARPIECMCYLVDIQIKKDKHHLTVYKHLQGFKLF